MAVTSTDNNKLSSPVADTGPSFENQTPQLGKSKAFSNNGTSSQGDKKQATRDKELSELRCEHSQHIRLGQVKYSDENRIHRENFEIQEDDKKTSVA